MIARKSGTRRPVVTPAAGETLDDAIQTIAAMPVNDLRDLWQRTMGRDVPAALTRDLLLRWLIHDLQEKQLGGLSPKYRQLLCNIERLGNKPDRHVKAGSVIVREYQGVVHEVLVVPDGFCWQGKIYSSLSTIARKVTGTSWNGPRFFGLRSTAAGMRRAADVRPSTRPRSGKTVPAEANGLFLTGERGSGAKR